MGRESRIRSLRQVLGRVVRPLRRWVGYTRKVLLLWSLRRTTDALRLLRVLPQRAATGSPLHLLIVNLTPHLGDTIMQMPMIEALRAAHPQAQIGYAVEESAAPLLRMMPELDLVYALKLGRIPPIGFGPSVKRAVRIMREYWKHMRWCAPTVCLLPRWGDDLFRSAVLAYLTGAPRRIGFTWRVVPGALPAPYRDALLTDRMHGGNAQHEAMRFCRLASDAGLIPHEFADQLSTRVVPSLQRIAATQDWKQLAERLGLDADGRFAVIAPGASHPKKMWPLERWAEVMAALRAEGLRVVLLSGASDADVASRLHQDTGGWAHLIAGRTSLTESLTLIAQAAVFLGNDSGPGHVAGALGIPTVTLFTTTPQVDPDDPYSPERNRPMGPFVACCRPMESLAPCVNVCMADSSHCIRGIAVGEVLAAMKQALQLREQSASTVEAVDAR